MTHFTDQFLIEVVPKLDDAELRITLALAILPPSADISRTELATRSSLSLQRLDDVLERWKLIIPAKVVVIENKRDGYHPLTLLSVVTGEEKKVRLRPAEPHAAEIAKLTADVDRLRLQLRARAQDESGLADEVNPEEAGVVRLAESLLARPLTHTESFRIGQLIQSYGPDRVKSALNAKRRSAHPIRAAYAYLANGGMGGGAKQKLTVRAIQYFTPQEDYEPW